MRCEELLIERDSANDWPDDDWVEHPQGEPVTTFHLKRGRSGDDSQPDGDFFAKYDKIHPAMQHRLQSARSMT